MSSTEPFRLRAGPAAICGGTHYLARASPGGRTEIKSPIEKNHTEHHHCAQPLAATNIGCSTNDLTENESEDFARMRRFFSPQALVPRVSPASLIAPTSDTFLGECRSSITSGRRIQQRPQSVGQVDQVYMNEGRVRRKYNDIPRVGAAYTVDNGLRVLGLELPRCKKRGKVQVVEDPPSKIVTRRMNAISWETPQGGAVMALDKALDVEPREVGLSAPILPPREGESAKTNEQDLCVKYLASSATLDEKVAVFRGKGINAIMKSSEKADPSRCRSRQCTTLREPNSWKPLEESSSSFEASKSKLTVEAVGRIGVGFDRSGTLQFVKQVNAMLTSARMMSNSVDVFI